ncbi:MAG: FlgD immunoglobulin-like domain containing protein [candidate division Zixibacteria bacterium]
MKSNLSKYVLRGIFSAVVILIGSHAYGCEYDHCGTLSMGALKTNTINSSLEIHSYRFSVRDGDNIMIRMARTGGTFQPRIELWGPNNNLLDVSGTGSGFAEIVDKRMYQNGYCRLLCYDYDGPGRGGYAFTVQRTNDPIGARKLSYEATIIDSLTSFAQLKPYKFSVNEGDAFIVQMIRLSGGIHPRLELFKPNGILLKASVDPFEAVAIINSVSVAGEYSILASDAQINDTGTFALIMHRLPTDVDNWAELNPMIYSLRQNYPNPFNPFTRIDFNIPKASFVTLDIYNILGEKVQTLISKDMTAGPHSVMWDSKNENGQEAASGIYYYRITSGEFTDSKKMLLLR